MGSIIRYSIITAARDWIFLGIMFVAIFVIAISLFFGNVALSEQGYMSSVYAASSLRLVVIFGLVIFVCFHIKRCIDNKEVEFILSKPISRTSFVFSCFAGFALLSLIVCASITILMIALQQFGIFWGDSMGVLFWGVSIYIESFVMMSFAFFASMFLNSASLSVMTCMIFYFLCRIFGFFLISIHNPLSLMKTGKVGYYGEKIIDVLSVVFPRLDLLSQSSWVIYGVESYAGVAIFMAWSIIYTIFILCITSFDLIRRQF